MTTEKVEPVFSPNAMRILEERYFLKDDTGAVIETPQGIIDRISFGDAAYYEMLVALDFLPNSPTIFNAGTSLGTLSACFKFDVQDALVGDFGARDSAHAFKDSIFGVAAKAASVLQFGGGVGYCLSALRPRGSMVKTTHKVASGPVGFMTLYQAVADSITQGGKRHGAQMCILHCDHADVEEFIDSKNTQAKADALSTFNISVAATDEWMHGNIEAESHSPRGSLLWKMAENAWRTGDPGCYFIDQSERTNPTPWLGVLTGTNPCGEVPLLDNEPCNLGSINLGHMLKPAFSGHTYSGDAFDSNKLDINWDKLEATVRLATRYLDDVLDHNQFPHEDIDRIAHTTRKLGLGVMGWADMLTLLHIHYDMQEAVDLGEKVMRKINDWALEESVKLSNEKGPAPAYETMPAGLNLEMRSLMPRNTTRTCIAPTGSISWLADCSSGIEPYFSRTLIHDNGHGRAVEITWPAIEKANFEPHYAMQIDPIWHIRHQAAFQRHVDLAVSKTINMPESATVKDIYDAYVEAWRQGCKGVTIYRDKSRTSQVLNATDEGRAVFIADPGLPVLDLDEIYPPEQVEAARATRIDLSLPPVRRRLLEERQAVTHKFQVGDQEGYITVGLYPDGAPGEVFIKVSKEGSTIAGLLDSLGIAISVGLQYGVPLPTLIAKYRNTNFEPKGLTSNRQIPTATSILDYLFHWLEHKFVPGAEVQLTYTADQIQLLEKDTGLLCPACGAAAYASEGCITCSRQCGWSRCG